jgi:hypothetical protein
VVVAAVVAAATEEQAALSRPGQAPRPFFLPNESSRAGNISGTLRGIDGSMKSARQHDGLDVAAQHSFGN